MFQVSFPSDMLEFRIELTKMTIKCSLIVLNPTYSDYPPQLPTRKIPFSLYADN